MKCSIGLWFCRMECYPTTATSISARLVLQISENRSCRNLEASSWPDANWHDISTFKRHLRQSLARTNFLKCIKEHSQILCQLFFHNFWRGSFPQKKCCFFPDIFGKVNISGENVCASVRCVSASNIRDLAFRDFFYLFLHIFSLILRERGRNEKSCLASEKCCLFNFFILRWNKLVFSRSIEHLDSSSYHLPDRTFHNFWVSKSRNGRTLHSSKASIYWFWGSKFVNCPVGYWAHLSSRRIIFCWIAHFILSSKALQPKKKCWCQRIQPSKKGSWINAFVCAVYSLPFSQVQYPPGWSNIYKTIESQEPFSENCKICRSTF